MTTSYKTKSRHKTSTFRNTIFWLNDRLKGSKIRGHYNAIQRINENHSSDYAVREQKKYLFQILEHAIETVPYYRNLGIVRKSLDQYPVVNKNLIKQHSKAFLSDRYANKKTFKATTSGSTGTPFTVLHDIDKKQRHKADVRFYWDSVNHAWGNTLYYLKIWNQQNSKSELSKKMQNIIPVDVFQLNDEKIATLLAAITAEPAPKSMLGYASALDRIAKYLDRNPTDISTAGVVSVIAMSESLDDHTKKCLEKHFKCPVVSRYANIENGMLAQQTTASGNNFLVNLASYHIEILDLQKDIPVKDGETGRIVVTDLFNRALPMIRYDTGDLGKLGKIEKNGKTQYVLKRIEGRKVDAIYNTAGESISSHTITNNMWKYEELNQYQFIQKGTHEYEFLLNITADFLREEELIKEFKGYLGSDATIVVNYVNEIPLLSSGKRKKVLNTTAVKCLG